MTFKNKYLLLASVLAWCLPAVTFAATFGTVVNRLVDVFKSWGVALISIAVFVIIFGVFRYINAGDDPARRLEAGKLLMWGIISVFAMLTFWGFVRLVANTFFSGSEINQFQRNNSLWNINSLND